MSSTSVAESSQPPIPKTHSRGEHSPKSRIVFATLIGLLVAGLVTVILLSLAIGAIRVSPGAILGALLRHQALTTTQEIIVLQIRLPRVLASAIVGAALAISGLMFQGLFRNPMADPYVIGSSGGAVLGACIGIFYFSQISFFGFSATALLAFAGSVITMAIVYSLARANGKTNVVTLLLAGFAVSTMLGYSSYAFELLDSSNGSNHLVLLSWLHGVIGIPRWTQLSVTGALLLFAIVIATPLMRQLNTLALGDEYAHQLGLKVEYTRVGIILAGSLLTAVAVSLGGLISFAGLIVPHVARLLLGPDHVRLLPVTALSGAIFLVLADTLARSVFAPNEVPVGILMAFIGGPFFLYLLRKTKRSYAL
ncbi:FecCD family ABC transporter permease [Tunturiibacter lichenicola]|uniref:FecCD family ABC transporter permease n=1 Tax=Tunturiibacter lichenicola TaxID=2051959 RepID=UPI003D9BF6E8